MAAAAVLAATALSLFYRLDQEILRATTSLGPTDAGRPVLQSMQQNIRWSYLIVIAVGAAGTLISLGCIWVIRRSLTSVLRNITQALSGSSTELNRLAEAVAASGRQLAEHASQAAASIEETSASLEEMASMTAQNARHAQNARETAEKTRRAADAGAADMGDLQKAIGEIQAGSDDVAKIIKTIDEIAFQTNILALNAAVEAARAGDAGLGFAVVADEVRSLAQRSALSARESSERIQSAREKTGQGVALVGQVSSSLAGIVDGNQKLDGLAAEVATASAEQSKGIDLLRSAVNDMDRVTQSNAAAADDTARALTALREQAQQVRAAVGQLRELIDGTTENFQPTPADVGAGVHAAPAVEPAAVSGSGPARGVRPLNFETTAEDFTLSPRTSGENRPATPADKMF